MTQALGFILSADTSSLLASMVQAGQVTDREAKRMERALQYVSAQLKQVQAAQKSTNDASMNAVQANNVAQMALRQHRAETNQLTQAYRQLPMQITDVVTSLAGGMPIWMIAIQQGGQIKDSFGGIVPAARALLTILTPLRVAIGGMGAAAGIAAYEIYQGHQKAEEFRKGLALTNNAAGLTADSFRQIAAAAAASSGQTVGAGREMAQALASTGRISRENMEAATRAGLLYAAATGESADEVAKDMAKMSDGVLKWAQEHNRSMHFMTAADMDRIRALESQGKTHEAAGVAIDAYNAHLEGTRKKLGLIEQAYKDVASAWSGWMAKLQDMGAPDGLGESLDAANKKLKAMQEQWRQYQATGGQGSLWSSMVGDSLKAQGDNRPSVFGRFNVSAAEFQQAMGMQQARIAKLQRDAQMEEELAQDKARTAKEMEQQALLTSKAYTDAEANLALAQNARQLEIVKNGLDARSRALEYAHARDLLSDKQYRDESFATEKARLEAEVRAAVSARNIEAGRKTENPIEAKSKDVAVTNADTKVASVQAQLAKLTSEYLLGTGKAYESVRNEIVKYAAETADMESQTRKLGAGEQWAAEKIKALKDSVKDLTDADRAQLAAEIRAEGHRRDYAAATVDIRNWIKTQADGVAAIDAETSSLGLSALAMRQAATSAKVLGEAQALALKYPERAAEIYADYINALESVKAAEKRRYEAARTFEMGMRAGVNSYIEAATDMATQMNQLFSRSFGGMEDALVSFITTGKLSFTSLANSIIADITRIIIKQQVMMPMLQAMGLSAGGSATSTGGIVGTLLGSLFGAPSLTGAGALDAYAAMDAGYSAMPHANGLDYVPRDGYIAMLHRGERVQSAVDASASRLGSDSDSGRGNRGGVVAHMNFAIQGPVDARTQQQIAAAAARGLQLAQARNN